LDGLPILIFVPCVSGLAILPWRQQQDNREITKNKFLMNNKEIKTAKTNKEPIIHTFRDQLDCRARVGTMLERTVAIERDEPREIRMHIEGLQFTGGFVVRAMTKQLRSISHKEFNFSFKGRSSMDEFEWKSGQRFFLSIQL
jgi:hypothetical protein